MVRSISHGEAMKRRVAILISGRGSNMAALIQAAAAEDFPAEIAVVISNRADAGGLEKARACGVPAVTIESKPFGKDRAAFAALLRLALGEHRVYPDALRLVASGRVRIEGDICKTAGGASSDDTLISPAIA